MSYNPNIPQPTDKLSNSQADLLGNASSANTIFGQDHFQFDAINGGKHQHVVMPGKSGGTPPTTVSGEGGIYTVTTGSNTDHFYTRDADATNVYQMTRITNDGTEYGRFATNTTYAAGPPTLTGGWTFLPGGMLFQYGQGVTTTTSAPNLLVTFPKAFTNVVYSVTATPIISTSNRRHVTIWDVATNQFRCTIKSGDGSTVVGTVYWQAIGV
ncbi:MAG: hypothetical protein PQJ44_06910 [Sphaerochaetaceae bacterium]|nr:hypothetical protein [Sphaerochaetaceae bacterium]